MRTTCSSIQHLASSVLLPHKYSLLFTFNQVMGCLMGIKLLQEKIYSQQQQHPFVLQSVPVIRLCIPFVGENHLQITLDILTHVKPVLSGQTHLSKRTAIFSGWFGSAEVRRNLVNKSDDPKVLQICHAPSSSSVVHCLPGDTKRFGHEIDAPPSTTRQSNCATHSDQK